MTGGVQMELPPVAGYQRDAIFCAERNSIIEATTKAGKTIGCIWWLVHVAATVGGDGREFWWVAPVSDQADIAYRRMIALFESVDRDKKHWSTNKTNKTIRISNGSTFRFKSADEPDSLYGEDVYAAVMDEASRAKEDAWVALRSTLTASKGMARIIGNVKGRHNWAYRLARRVEAGSLPGWRHAKITCYDAVKAGIISQDEVEAARRELPEAAFRELYEGIPSEDGENPFGASHIAECWRDGIPPDAVACWGIDLAKSTDWTWAVGISASGAVVASHRWQRVPWSETTERLRLLVGSTPALADSTGVGDPIVETLQARCPAVEGLKFTQLSKQQLMEGLAVAIQQHSITFADPVLRAELESFEYEHTRTGVRYSAPEGFHDDGVCALALAVRHLSSCGDYSASTVQSAGRSADVDPQYADIYNIDPAKADADAMNRWYRGLRA